MSIVGVENFKCFLLIKNNKNVTHPISYAWENYQKLSQEDYKNKKMLSI